MKYILPLIAVVLLVASCEKPINIGKQPTEFKMDLIDSFEMPGSEHYARVYECEVITSHNYILITDTVYNSRIAKRKILVR